MLYKIKTGHNVRQVHQSRIIHLVFKLKDIIDEIDYLFTDGHGFNRISQWFDDLAFLGELDWEVIPAHRWNPTEIDSDRMRRKQSEFWVKEELNIDKMLVIGVFNQQSLDEVKRIMVRAGVNIPAKVKEDYYY